MRVSGIRPTAARLQIVKWLRKTMSRKDIEEIFPGKRENMISRLRTLNKIILAMMLFPVVLLALTIGASLERTPLTGRQVYLFWFFDFRRLLMELKGGD